jgi:predicted Kef-type K+ transport protein
MIRRLKRALTESYIGAIALGWLLAQDIMELVNALATPLGDWANRREYPKMAEMAGGGVGSSFQLALPGVVRFFLILVIWYALVQWLYLGPSNAKSSYSKADA